MLFNSHWFIVHYIKYCTEGEGNIDGDGGREGREGMKGENRGRIEGGREDAGRGGGRE